MNTPFSSEGATLAAPYRAFVTGGTGLVGAHLLYELTSQGIAVTALSRSARAADIVRRTFCHYTARPEALLARIQWLQGDLRNADILAAALQGADSVFHCAALVSFNPADRQAIHQINVEGTVQLVEQCRRAGICKLVFVSSSAAIGKPEHGLAEENTPYIASNVPDYARSKYEAEQVVWQAIAAGLPAVIVNPVVVLGPGDWQRSSAAIVWRVWRGFPFYTLGGTGFVDARDVARCMAALMESPIVGERFILCSENLVFRDVFFQIADALGTRRPPLRAYPWMGAVALRLSEAWSLLSGRPPLITPTVAQAAHQRYFFSNEKIKQAIGHTFIPMEQSIRDTCRCFLRDAKRGALTYAAE